MWPESASGFNQRLESAAASQHWSSTWWWEMLYYPHGLFFKNSWALIFGHSEFIVCWERLFIEVCDYIMKTMQIFIFEGHVNEIYSYSKWNIITICKFEFIIKKDFLKKLKNVHYHIINSVPYLRTNFALSVGLGIFNTDRKLKKSFWEKTVMK